MDGHKTTTYEESEFEYEYDPNETETFYVDLDLSSTDRGSKEPLKKKKPDGEANNEGGAASQPPTPARDHVQAEDSVINLDNDAHDEPEATPAPRSLPPANDIQVLDFHNHNPMISYQNQIYSCTWSDMIGTAMFFSQPKEGDGEDALLCTGDFHLINTSRIKLIGQKVKLTGKPGRKRRRAADNGASEVIHWEGDEWAEGETVTNEESIRETRRGQANNNRQAAFLEKLMSVKRAKGELDGVRTVFNHRKGTPTLMRPPDSSARGATRTDEYGSTEREIEELNRRVVRGDATALARLQDIYSTMEEDAQNQVSPESPPAASISVSNDATVAAANMFEQRHTPPPPPEMTRDR